MFFFFPCFTKQFSKTNKCINYTLRQSDTSRFAHSAISTLYSQKMIWLELVLSTKEKLWLMSSYLVLSKILKEYRNLSNNLILLAKKLLMKIGYNGSKRILFFLLKNHPTIFLELVQLLPKNISSLVYNFTIFLSIFSGRF